MLPDVLEISPTITIPITEIVFRFSRSSGKGGQHVNKVSTKAEASFTIEQSPSIPPEIKARLATKLRSRLTSDGSLRVVVQTERSQMANRVKAVKKLETILKNALKEKKKRLATKPTRASKEERLHAKKARSTKLKSRRIADND